MNTESKCIKFSIADFFFGTINLGLTKGYSREQIEKSLVYRFLSDYQKRLRDTRNIVLSASVSEMDIVLAGQLEPHLKISFINYPKFPLPLLQLKKEVISLASSLMHEFEQNRIVVVFHDETLMLEASDLVEPKIYSEI